jgi:hypothetical protein
MEHSLYSTIDLSILLILFSVFNIIVWFTNHTIGHYYTHEFNVFFLSSIKGLNFNESYYSSNRLYLLILVHYYKFIGVSLFMVNKLEASNSCLKQLKNTKRS